MILTSVYRGMGYLHTDYRASGGQLTEVDVMLCPHCQKVLRIPTTQTEGPACRRCNRPICEPCAVKMDREGCVPFRKLIDQQLAKEARDRAYTRALGL